MFWRGEFAVDSANTHGNKDNWTEALRMIIQRRIQLNKCRISCGRDAARIAIDNWTRNCYCRRRLVQMQFLETELATAKVYCWYRREFPRKENNNRRSLVFMSSSFLGFEIYEFCRRCSRRRTRKMIDRGTVFGMRGSRKRCWIWG